jgi:hypothetical protein
MLTKEEIDKGMAVHSRWKERLLDAISNQRTELNPELIKTEKNCEFGRWLTGLEKEGTQSEDYKTIKALHIEFHKTASEILSLAARGKRQEALNKFQSGGQYSIISGKLVLALRAWKDKL